MTWRLGDGQVPEGWYGGLAPGLTACCGVERMEDLGIATQEDPPFGYDG